MIMQFNLNQLDIITLLQSLKPLLMVKVIFIFILLGYALFQLIVFRQIRLMERVITQPVSSAIVTFISLAFVAASVMLMIAVWFIPI